MSVMMIMASLHPRPSNRQDETVFKPNSGARSNLFWALGSVFFDGAKQFWPAKPAGV